MHNQDPQLHFLEHIFDSLQNGVIVLDKDLNIVKANKWALDKLSLEKNLTGTHCYKTLNNADLPCAGCPALKTFKTGKAVKDFIHKFLDNKAETSFEINTYPVLDQDGNVEYVIENYYDITDLKRTENTLKEKNDIILKDSKKHEQLNKNLETNIKELKAQEQLMQTIFDNAPSIMILMDTNTRIIKINKTGLDFSGFREQEVTGLSCGDIFCCKEVINNANPCGNGENCNKCTIRNTIEDTAKTGNVHYQVEALIDCVPNNKSGKCLEGLISTSIVKVNGKDAILVSIEDISQLKQQERIIAENEKRYRSLYDNAPLSYQSLDKDGNVIDVNPQWLKTLGYTRDEVIGRWFGDFLHPEQRALFIKRFPRFKAKGLIHNTQFEMQRKDGTNIYVSYEGCIGYDSEGNFKQTYCTFKDITEEKKSKDQLDKNRITLERLFSVVPTGIGQVKDRILTEANSKLLEILGYSKDELIGKSTEILYPSKEDYEYVGREKYRQIAESGTGTVETRFKKKNGKIIDILLSSTPIDDKDISKGTIFTVLDISDRIKYEKRLEENKKLHLSFITNLQTGVIVHNKDTSVSFNNPKSEELLGLKSQQIKGKKATDSIWNFVYEDNTKLPVDEYPVMQVINNKKALQNMVVGISRNKYDMVWLIVNGFPILDDKNEIKQIIISFNDITNEKKNALLLEKKNEEIERSNKELKLAKEEAEESNKLKTEFLNNMSHEVRTPMNGIIGFSDMLDNQELSDDKRKNYVKIVQNSSNQLLKVIDDILEISTLETKQEKFDKTALCLNDLLMETFSIFNLQSKERNIPLYLKKELADSRSFIYSDKSRLRKILDNLLENALRYTNAGFIELGYYIKDSTLTIYVKDTGIGIAPEKQKIIFERFSQANVEISRKHGGLGLGLSISRENAQLLGGDITLESTIGDGSTFYVNIPYQPANTKVTEDTTDNLEEKEQETAFTILVAEDEEINYLYLEALLIEESEKNYKLIHAINGQQAVDICMNNDAIDLVLMDIKMPVMGGHEATRLIKEKFPDLPVIAQTAYSSRLDRKLAMKNGCDNFISKPIDKEDFFELMDKYLDNE